ncbi:outer membrane channel protein [Catenovulum agarivorans DS-2]|uniref:Outer membrane channel protein n=1 Tax=Catenovulum agarivorans DS-2 TaxID=1328313 RepID=W7R3P4_9ALTE|nr:TolC family outer membrane protein [Catenovulum agarivorans]EWH12245.1 outer membrane channel protein [Catenovulum agarivorans DS-2]
MRLRNTLITSLFSVLLTPLACANSIIDIYQTALEQDPSIRQAQANFMALKQANPLARASLLPQLNASLAHNQDNINDRTTQSAGVNLRQSLYKHSNWLNLSKSEQQIQQGQFTLTLAEFDLTNRVVSAYLDLLEAQDTLTFVQAEKQAIERELEKTKQQLKVGISAITNLHEAQAQFDAAVAQEISASNAIELAKEALREITGQYYQTVEPLNTENFTPPALNPAKVDDWLNIAAANNPSLLGQKIAVAIAKKDIDIASAGHLPEANFEAGYNWQDIDSPTQQGDATGVTWSLSVSVPIYSGGATSAQSRQARHQYVSASQALEQTQRSVIKQVRSAYNDVKATLARIKALKQSVVSAESALNATKAGFNVGTRTIVDVLNSTKVVYDAKRNLASARYQYIKAIVGLKSAAGNLSVQDIQAISRLSAA